MKSVLYRFGIGVLKLFWQLQDSRHITAFGVQYKVTPETVFPDHRHLRLPQREFLSEIVRYTDFVQLHAVFRHISEMKEAPTIIDVGAYHGTYAIILGKLAQRLRGKIIAVEPNPESFQILKKNIYLNGLEDTIICEPIAVLDKPAFANIEFQGSESYLTKKQTGNTAEVTTLRDLMRKHHIENVDLLIIDVEGGELLVLKGFPWESAKVDKIFCELHPYAWNNFGYSGEDLRRFLKDHGYRCLDMYLKEHKIFDNSMYIGPTLFAGDLTQ